MNPTTSVTATWVKALLAFAIIFVPGGLIALFGYAILRAFLAARARAVSASAPGRVGFREVIAELAPSKLWEQTRSYLKLLVQVVDH